MSAVHLGAGGSLAPPPRHRQHSHMQAACHSKCTRTCAPRRRRQQLSGGCRVVAGASAGAEGPTTPTGAELSKDLIRYYHQVQEPALANRRYSGAVADFTTSCILAYECGYSEDSLREQLQQALNTGESGLAPAHAQNFDAGECVAAIALVWLTLMLSPKTVQRWATVSAVSEQTQATWKGFVGMIVHAYFERRMAWFPVDRLSMEMAAMGQPPEAPDIVAERARLVFTTLERVHPQFPSD